MTSISRGFVHESSYVDADVEIGEGTTIWHFCHVMSGSRIGRDVVLGQNCFVASGVVIGDGCRIQNNVSLYTGVVLEDGVFCGPSVVFTNVRTPRAGVNRRGSFEPTLVKRGASLGANCTVVCGCVVGEYALVGAGAVVSRDVPPHRLVVGVPARVTGWVCRCGEVLDLAANAPRGQSATCGRCGEVFVVP